MVRDYMKEFGYSDREIDRLLNCVRVNSYREEHLCEKVKLLYNYFLDYGFSNEDIRIITYRYPSIYSCGIDKIKMRNNMFIVLGLTKYDIIREIKIMPSVYGLSEENFREKICFFRKIGILDVVIRDFKKMICSIDLLFARYMFYKNIGIKINKNNCNLLFASERSFVNKYGKNNKTLIMLYNYDEFKNRESVRKKI